jgi:hypothetical protein
MDRDGAALWRRHQEPSTFTSAGCVELSPWLARPPFDADHRPPICSSVEHMQLFISSLSSTAELRCERKPETCVDDRRCEQQRHQLLPQAAC